MLEKPLRGHRTVMIVKTRRKTHEPGRDTDGIVKDRGGMAVGGLGLKLIDQGLFLEMHPCKASSLTS